ncbi:MAG: hypothetical protein ACKVS5_07475 [Parvularculaceae bacterium]
MKYGLSIATAMITLLGAAIAAPVTISATKVIDESQVDGTLTPAAPALNNLGDVAFLVDRLMARQSLFAVLNGQLTEVRTVNPPNNGPGNILSPSIDINDSGQVVYLESVQSSSPDQKISIYTAGATAVVLNNQNQAFRFLPTTASFGLSINNDGLARLIHPTTWFERRLWREAAI